ncbi:hypothetical protein [Chelatococcus reniformis]|uniref:Uncharacterized protein n=1 Tax=Chelatococcus reniformis TaxID=1494448 RepID=A0A916XFM5_9HYPH|nr:hypothetical protein [Chelatococcus reniformis]GGC68383.1 hypothetical protein GCM10010994_28680 [Chelatococcus reniformis]
MVTDPTDDLRRCFLGYAQATGLKVTTVGRLAAKDGRFFTRLNDPELSFTLKRYNRLLEWFSANWPEETNWPEGVRRPASEVVQ